MKHLRLLALALMSLGFTACLESTVPDYNTVENTTFDSSLGIDLANFASTDAGVYYKDITVGSGAVVTPGADNFMFFHAYFSNGVEFESVQPPELPATFRTGDGSQLLPGFEIGVQGMKVGGERQILIPPALAFGLGDFRAGNVFIPGNSVLVYTVQLVNPDGTTGSTTTP
jgi:FKBP-type peptidyl-prolyl cis-trans isomerase